MKKIFITGGAGFICSHLIEKIIDENIVIIYDNLIRNSIKYINVLDHKNLKLIEGDVLDSATLTQAMKGSNIVVHAAAIAGIYSVNSDAWKTMKVNVIGAYNALEAAVENRIDRFVDFSTSEVYGPFVYNGKESDSTTLGPVGEKRWVYAVSKLAAEHFAHTYQDKYGMEIVTIRPFNIYGPRQIGEGAVQQMIIKALRNEPIIVYNQGTQIRAWCYIDDFINALRESLFNSNAAGNIFNVGNPLGTVTNIELANKIKTLTESNSTISFKPHPGPEVEIRIPDITKAKNMLGYNPVVSLDDGLKKAVSWYKEHL